ncbi:hypothetical protein [Variovorax paradoxus]|uniref:Sulfotransferase family protein n=1 Tax=Variovorax paradoxus (strain EPS) TaxID=595537 RepID=E6VAZ2_VARPE|nr:hypothetical protein [Variovorax paradoxus]ADU37441.1 hypothetical protein Varpa_3255 [Variovorax paradoxus EPS]
MKSHHLLIAGTGRAGTTFLVQYLAECGLDTQLAHQQRPGYDEDANAGLEDLLVGNADAPYVVKSPWLYEFVERLLADPGIVVDAVVIPMRSIVEAATSRTVNELRARHGNTALPDDCKQWETWASTQGGIVYSLNPIDQARLLALGFHELLHALVKRNIPVVLLDFPRFIEDPDYLYEALRPTLGCKLDRKAALRAHVHTAVPSKVRIGKELAVDGAAEHGADAGPRPTGIAFPSHAILDRTALKRALDKTAIRNAQLEEHLAAMQASRSWRITAPLRGITRLMQRLRREVTPSVP